MNGVTPEPALAERLADRDFAAVVEFIEREVGIRLPPTKRTMVEGRLRKRVRALGLPNLAEYGRHVFASDESEAELTHLIDCVTTNKTDFFREPAHFDFLRGEALPKLLARTKAGQPRLKLWSAACSVGAEAYTIAMVLDDAGGSRSFQYTILGTDISTEVLAQAREGIYPVEMIEPVPAAMRQRYVMVPRDPDGRRVRIVPELRRRTVFRRLNLMERSYPVDDDVDVIMCRNVLIYFDKPTQAKVIERLAGHLRPGGYLILGHSESMAGASALRLRQIHPTVFQA